MENSTVSSNRRNTGTTAKPAKLWMGTIPFEQFTPYLPAGIAYTKGQLEEGEGGYLHWQIFVNLSKPQRCSWLAKCYGIGTHWERTRSEAAEEYVWKEETRVHGTQFELGEKPLQRNNCKDWDQIRTSAIEGRLLEIPADVYVRSYQSLKRIACDHMVCPAITRTIFVFWGKTGVGKSRKAWDLASLEAYPKDPRTKFWDGYQGQANVVIDEFRGGVDIGHVLRWFDRYPVIVEVKGSSVPLKATTIWITSNLHPRDWYPGLDRDTYLALERRLEIEELL